MVFCVRLEGGKNVRKFFCNDKTMKLIRAVSVIGRVSSKGFACITGMYEDI